MFGSIVGPGANLCVSRRDIDSHLRLSCGWQYLISDYVLIFSKLVGMRYHVMPWSVSRWPSPAQWKICLSGPTFDRHTATFKGNAGWIMALLSSLMAWQESLLSITGCVFFSQLLIAWNCVLVHRSEHIVGRVLEDKVRIQKVISITLKFSSDWWLMYHKFLNSASLFVWWVTSRIPAIFRTFWTLSNLFLFRYLEN